jgi:hypothetical protein
VTNKIKPKSVSTTPAKPAVTETAKTTKTAPAAPVDKVAKAAATKVSSESSMGAAKALAPKPAGATVTGVQGVPANPRDMAIVCPVLGSLIAEGKVKMEPDGTVKISDLRKSFGNDLGFTADHQFRASNVGVFANKITDVLNHTVTQKFNVLDMRAGLIKHQGDSAILTGGQFDQAKFDAFVSHAKDGKMTETAFAEAIAANYVRDFDGRKFPADRAKNTAEGEYGAILAVFGQKDAKTGEMYLTVDDLKGMFKDKRLPKHIQPTANKDVDKMSKSLEKKSDAFLASNAFRSTATASGMANAGARLVDGGAETASAQAAVSAGKAANCPHLNGAAKMPTNTQEIVTQHSNPM